MSSQKIRMQLCPNKVLFVRSFDEELEFYPFVHRRDWHIARQKSSADRLIQVILADDGFVRVAYLAENTIRDVANLLLSGKDPKPG